MWKERGGFLGIAVAIGGLVLAVLVAGGTSFSGSEVWARSDGGTAALVSEPRAVGDFSRIEIAGPIDVDLRIGSRISVVAQARNAEDLRHIVTHVRGDRLVVEGRHLRRWSWKRHPLRVAVVVPALEAATISGAGDLSVTGLDGGDFSIRISGAGDATLTGRCAGLDVDLSGAGDLDISDLTCRRLTLAISGAGDIMGRAGDEITADVAGAGDVRLVGQCRRARIRVRGAGDFRGSKLMCESVDARVSGAGDVIIGVRGPVWLHRSGVGDITVLGDPDIREIEGSGPGDIHIRRSAASGG